MSNPTEVLTYIQVAAELGCSVRTARRFVAQGKLRGMRYGHRLVRFRRADVERTKAKFSGEDVRQW